MFPIFHSPAYGQAKVRKRQEELWPPPPPKAWNFELGYKANHMISYSNTLYMCVYLLFMIHTYEMFTDLMLLWCDDCGVMLRIWLVVAMTENVSGTQIWVWIIIDYIYTFVYIYTYIYIHTLIYVIYILFNNIHNIYYKCIYT